MSDLVHETEPGGEKAVRGVLGKLRTAGAHPQERDGPPRSVATGKPFAAEDPPVKLCDHLSCFGRTARDDPVGEECVV